MKVVGFVIKLGGMIHFFYRSHAKKPESGLFSESLDRKQYR